MPQTYTARDTVHYDKRLHIVFLIILCYCEERRWDFYIIPTISLEKEKRQKAWSGQPKNDYGIIVITINGLYHLSAIKRIDNLLKCSAYWRPDGRGAQDEHILLLGRLKSDYSDIEIFFIYQNRYRLVTSGLINQKLLF